MAQIDENGAILVFNRRTARDLAFKYLFQWKVTGYSPAEILENLDTLDFTRDDSGYIRQAVNGVAEHVQELDAYIEQHSKGWKKNRISNVCISAMRLALYEIKHMDEIPLSVSINEAVELIKTYDSPETAAFANGILGKAEKSESR